MTLDFGAEAGMMTRTFWFQVMIVAAVFLAVCAALAAVEMIQREDDCPDQRACDAPPEADSPGPMG